MALSQGLDPDLCENRSAPGTPPHGGAGDAPRRGGGVPGQRPADGAAGGNAPGPHRLRTPRAPAGPPGAHRVARHGAAPTPGRWSPSAEPRPRLRAARCAASAPRGASEGAGTARPRQQLPAREHPPQCVRLGTDRGRRLYRVEERLLSKPRRFLGNHFIPSSNEMFSLFPRGTEGLLRWSQVRQGMLHTHPTACCLHLPLPCPSPARAMPALSSALGSSS